MAIDMSIIHYNIVERLSGIYKCYNNDTGQFDYIFKCILEYRNNRDERLIRIKLDLSDWFMISYSQRSYEYISDTPVNIATKNIILNRIKYWDQSGAILTYNGK